ncbi:hypothetical protein D3C75_881560 [compost metagenome]
MMRAIKSNKSCLSCNSKRSQNTPKQKEILKNSSSGKNNPMYGKSYYDVWIEKYGKEEADKKQALKIERNRKASIGENNPMYGKPSPQGSGNGWSGHYEGVQFRSILELRYLKYLFDNNIAFENGEKTKYKVSYEFNNKKANYFLDFYLPEMDEYIEIKPKKLVSSKQNKAKFDAARNKFGDKFKVLTEDDISTFDLNKMHELFVKKVIVFDKQYEEKFIKYYEDNK